MTTVPLADPRIPVMTKDTHTQLTAAGMLLCAVGIVLQIVTGATGYPTVPPGALITAAVGLVVLFVPWRFIPALGLLVGAFITFGAFATSDTGDRLSDPGTFGPFIGTVVQLIGLAAAIVFGLLATIRAARRTSVS